MTDRPSDRGIAQAFWDHDQNCKTAATRWIEDRAREIDAEMPQRAQLDRELVLANQLQDCRLQMKAVWDFLSPNESNDMEWADEIIIAIQNYSLPSQDAEDAARYRWLRDNANPGYTQSGKPWAVMFSSERVENWQEMERAIDAARAARGGGS